MATITSKGQITLPKKIREALGLRPGSQVECEIQGSVVILRKHVPEEAFQRWQGFLRDKTGTKRTDELMEKLRGE